MISVEQIINSKASQCSPPLAGDVVFVPIPFLEEKKITIFTF